MNTVVILIRTSTLTQPPPVTRSSHTLPLKTAWVPIDSSEGTLSLLTRDVVPFLKWSIFVVLSWRYVSLVGHVSTTPTSLGPLYSSPTELVLSLLFLTLHVFFSLGVEDPVKSDTIRVNVNRVRITFQLIHKIRFFTVSKRKVLLVKLTKHLLAKFPRFDSRSTSLIP